MDKSLELKNEKILKFSFLIIGMILLTNFFNYGYLFLDGSRIILYILGNELPRIDSVDGAYHLRFFDVFLQLPLYFGSVFKLTNYPFVAEFLYVSSYVFIHAFSLAWCFKYLKRRQRLDEFIFPVLIYLFLAINTIFFQGNFLNNIFPLIWPLVFLVKEQSRKYFLVQSLLIIALSLTYESVFLLLISLSLFFFLEGSKVRSLILVLSGVFIFSYVSFLFPALSQNASVTDFVNTLKDTRFLFSFFPCFLFFCVIFYFKNKNINLILFGVLFFYLGLYLYHWNYFLNPYSSYFMKYFSILGMCLFVLCYWVYRKNKVELKPLSMVLILLFAIPNSLTFFRTSFVHRESVIKLKKNIKSSSAGCNFISKNAFRQNFGSGGIADTMVHFYSVMLQFPESIDKLIFTNVFNWDKKRLEEINPCHDTNELDGLYIMAKNIHGNPYSFTLKNYPFIKFQ